MKLNYILLLITIFSTNAFADDLGAKIDALSAKIDSMQTAIMSKLDEMSSGASKEQEARSGIIEIQSLIAADKFDDAKTKITEFMKKFSGTEYASSVERLKSEVDVVGKPIPSKWNVDKWYHLEKEVDLNSNKPTFIIFWEVWCPHCQREVPKIVELKNKYASKGVQFVGLTKLSRGITEDDLNKFIKDKNINYTIGKEGGDLSNYFAVTGVPAAVFIKNKKVIWRGHPALATSEKIEKWIK